MENIKSDNASEIAEKFAAERNAQGYDFNFSLESLEKEVDGLLKSNYNLDAKINSVLEAELTAYIGETICRLFQGEWIGLYLVDNPGMNFYTCKIAVNEREISPSHFIAYYFSNGHESMGSFKEYFYRKLFPFIT